MDDNYLIIKNKNKLAREALKKVLKNLKKHTTFLEYFTYT